MIKTLESACYIKTGKLNANAAVKDGIYPFFTCAESPDEIDHYAFDDDVVLVAGNNARGNFHVNRYKGKFNAYQRTYILTTKAGYSIDFIYYALKLELKRLREKAQGSQTKFLTMPILTSISLRNITYDEQCKIAHTLVAIDKKIELNNQTNSELEAIAKMLYDYWFVQFDFPDINGQPYKSSGGKMAYNEVLKREIPEGWEVKPVSEIIEVRDGTHDSPKPSEKGEYLITSKHLQPSGIDFSNAYFISYEDFEAVNKRSKVDEGDFLISMIGTIGLSQWVMKITTPFAIKNIGLFKTSQSPEYADYIFASVTSSYGKAYLQQNQSTGTSQPYVTLGTLRGIPITIPSRKVFDDFNIKVKPIHKLLYENATESQKLVELRDWLLPMLMNGQVTVSQ